jgi:hypothetical protein
MTAPLSGDVRLGRQWIWRRNFREALVMATCGALLGRCRKFGGVERFYPRRSWPKRRSVS